MELGKRLRKCRVVETDEVDHIIGKASRKISFSAIRQCLLANDLPEEYRNMLQKNAYDILRVEHHLKDYYDILSDHYDYHPEKLSVGEMERNFFLRVRNTLDNRMDVKMFFPKGKENLFLYVDKECLEYALLELILNAQQHALTDPDTRKEIRIWVSGAGKGIRFSISDNGQGMDEEELTHCCEPGFSMSEDRNSLGLGLCLVRYFASVCHGKFDLSSEKGKGTTVKLTIPRATEEECLGVASAKIASDEYPNPVDIMLGV